MLRQDLVSNGMPVALHVLISEDSRPKATLDVPAWYTCRGVLCMLRIGIFWSTRGTVCAPQSPALRFDVAQIAPRTE